MELKFSHIDVLVKDLKEACGTAVGREPEGAIGLLG
jgi:hypothetical protein